MGDSTALQRRKVFHLWKMRQRVESTPSKSKNETFRSIWADSRVVMAAGRATGGTDTRTTITNIN